MIAGGCYCRRVRYEVNGTPFFETLCHCSICRRTTGSALVGWFTVKREQLRIVGGEPRSFRSSDAAQRWFCADCGTQLLFALDAQPELVDVTIGSLDDPDALPPRDHTRTSSRLRWLELGDRLPRHREARGRTALLVVDVQRAAFDGVRLPPIAEADALIANTLALIDAARAAATPVVFIQHLGAPGEAFAEGAPGGALHESLSPRADERVVQKRFSNGFEKTELARALAELGASELVLCGLQSEFCVYHTALGALAEGYSVHVAADAHATWPSAAGSAEAIVARVNRELGARGARLAPTAELVASLGR